MANVKQIIFGLLIGLNTLWAQNNLYKKYIDSLELKGHNPTELILYSDRLLLTETLPDSLVGYIYLKKGSAYQSLNNYTASVTAFTKALKIYGENKHWTKNQITVLINRASSYAFLKNQPQAIADAYKALQLSEKINNVSSVANVYSVLSHIYYTFSDWDKAIENLKITEQIQQKQNDKNGLSATYNNLAILYKNQNKFAEALHYNQLSLQINQQQDNQEGVAKSYNNIGLVYYKKGSYQQAIIYFNKAISLNQTLQLTNSNPLVNLASVYHSLQQYPKEKEYLLEALTLENQLNNFSVIKDLYDNLLTNAILQNNNNEALFYQEKTKAIQDKLTAQENQQKIQMMESQKKLFKNENNLLMVQRNNQTKLIIISILGVLFIVTLFLFIQREKNKNLKNQKEKILLEQKVLRSQMNPHFIFNVLSAIQNSLMDNNPLQSATYMSNFAKLIRQNFDFIQKEKITLTEDLEALENYIKTQQFRFDNKFDYHIHIHPDIDPDDVQIPPLLLQPFVENAIEHGIKPLNHKGILQISIIPENDKIAFSITDNGVGYNPKPSDKEHALDIFKKRLQLMDKKVEESFSIGNTSEGTQVKFYL